MYAILTHVLKLLTTFTNVFAGSYIWQKGSIVGPTFKTPFIGPFLQSVNPKFEEYKAKWASGELSCVSVFHKYEQFDSKYLKTG